MKTEQLLLKVVLPTELLDLEFRRKFPTRKTLSYIRQTTPGPLGVELMSSPLPVPVPALTAAFAINSASAPGREKLGFLIWPAARVTSKMLKTYRRSF